MFENLTDRLEGVFKKLRGHGVLLVLMVRRIKNKIKRRQEYFDLMNKSSR